MAAWIAPPMIKDALVAQLDRALPSEGRGHRFESCRVHHFLEILIVNLLILKHTFVM